MQLERREAARSRRQPAPLIGPARRLARRRPSPPRRRARRFTAPPAPASVRCSQPSPPTTCSTERGSRASIFVTAVRSPARCDSRSGDCSAPPGAETHTPPGADSRYGLLPCPGTSRAGSWGPGPALLPRAPVRAPRSPGQLADGRLVEAQPGGQEHLRGIARGTRPQPDRACPSRRGHSSHAPGGSPPKTDSVRCRGDRHALLSVSLTAQLVSPAGDERLRLRVVCLELSDGLQCDELRAVAVAASCKLGADQVAKRCDRHLDIVCDRDRLRVAAEFAVAANPGGARHHIEVAVRREE